MVENPALSKKKKTPKNSNEKSKDELQWEIRVCQEAMKIQTQKASKVKRSDTLGNVLRFAFLLPLAALILSRLGMNLLLAILIPVGLILVLNAFLTKMIHKERGITPYGCADCLEVLSERLRIAKLCVEALENNTTLSESEKKYRLSFFNADKRICGNCAYMGKMIWETKTTYSDGSTSTSSKLDHCYCNRMNEMHVKKSNTCDKFYSKRIAKAFESAEKIYAEAEEALRETDRKTENGFR